ncbi:hypothetical protein [Vibrio coralliilyticus]|uniref:hypothetical protein n=1 Tax=Vibrio coralliilyticus TaxID=190893 RepID=UPI0003914374|nr:hypothetical protein N779_09390 [Vibrio coralliilyticus OCN008]
MKRNQRLYWIVVPALLLTSWYAYARTKGRDKLANVPPPKHQTIPNLEQLLDKL